MNYFGWAGQRRPRLTLAAVAGLGCWRMWWVVAWVETRQMIPTGFVGRVLGGSGGGGGGWGTMRAVVREGRESRDSCLD